MSRTSNQAFTPPVLPQAIAFTDEQAMLLEAATSFCREQSPTSAVRTRMSSEHGFDRSLWDAMVALGWSGIAIAEQHGGSGLTLAEVAIIAEPMGRHLLATPFASTQLFVQGVLAGGTPEQQAALLPPICGGAIGTVALMEEDGDWTLDMPQAQAMRTDAGVTLSGTKALIPDAAVADVILVSVRLEGELALAVVRREQLGVHALRRETIIDETRRSFALELAGIIVPASSVIEGAAAQAALAAVQRAGWLIASAEGAGGVAGTLDVVVDYLNTRTTFGRKIGSYQSLKHTCADMLVNLERSRSHVCHAATLIAEGADDAALEIALRMAKAESGDGFVLAGDRAVQFHGGFGFTWDCDAQLFLRRALWLQYQFGDAAHHRRKLADLLLGPVH
jgi:alkylation response protein AidB-like acyl-CoA dehydrogenase